MKQPRHEQQPGQEEAEGTQFDALPPELVEAVWLKLDQRSQASFLATCKQYRECKALLKHIKKLQIRRGEHLHKLLCFPQKATLQQLDVHDTSMLEMIQYAESNAGARARLKSVQKLNFFFTVRWA